MEQTLEIEHDIPIIESRGRPVSLEYATLVRMPVGKSFCSKKTRDSLYQIARNLGIKVTVVKAEPGKGWRVWKRSERDIGSPLPAVHVVAPKRRRKR